jgi:hypothetical protein
MRPQRLLAAKKATTNILRSGLNLLANLSASVVVSPKEIHLVLEAILAACHRGKPKNPAASTSSLAFVELVVSSRTIT